MLTQVYPSVDNSRDWKSGPLPVDLRQKAFMY